jgi:outer membrane protein OmpA-like peptidoglycan-associated protein
MYDKFQPTRLGGREQVTLIRRSYVRITLLSVALLAPACGGIEQANDSKLTLDTPIGWWHDLQGGKIAEVRPPPPGVTDPYPNLGQVPARPVLTDAATRRALAARLASERDRTQREAIQDPLVLPAASVAPARRAATASSLPAAPPPDPNASVAVLEAATAPAPTPALAAAPAIPEAAAAMPAPSAPQTAKPPAPQAAQPAAESGPLPSLPAAEPPLPRLGGLPASVNEPAVPRVAPGVSVAFRPGSATLPAAADASLRELAGRRAGATIAVTAGGNAAGASAEAQARALPLALRRTRAMQDVLTAAGVPAAALRVDAAAMGRGGAAHLIQQ